MKLHSSECLRSGRGSRLRFCSQGTSLGKAVKLWKMFACHFAARSINVLLACRKTYIHLQLGSWILLQLGRW